MTDGRTRADELHDLGLSWPAEVIRIHEAVEKKWPAWTNEDRNFLALALCGEVGELANLIKKDWRGDAGSAARFFKMREEIADVAIYLTLLARAIGVDIDEAARDKIGELHRRWPEAAP